MRSYSLFTILLLCLILLIVDIIAFYWLQSITLLIASSFFKSIINLLFWVFTIVLIFAIIYLKISLDNINPKRKQLYISSLYGLTVSSFIPKVLFIIIISVLHFANYMFTEKESLVIIPLVGLLSGVFPLTIILYGIFKTRYSFKINHIEIKLESLPDNFNNLKVVHISDIHIGSFNYKYHILEKAVKLINSLNPDYIFFTGDLVNNYAWELRGWEKVFNKLTAIKGKYAVLGNHDYGDYCKWNTKEKKKKNFNAIKQFYTEIGFKLLLNENEIVFANGESFAIIGVENWGALPFKQYGNLHKALKNTENISFKILLSHDPTHWSHEIISETNIALTLSGHTHGMQAGINIKDKQWSPIKYKYKHWAGLYKHENQYLYVNRGLGWLGFPGRLGMRPEITEICIKT